MSIEGTGYPPGNSDPSVSGQPQDASQPTPPNPLTDEAKREIQEQKLREKAREKARELLPPLDPS